MSLFFISLLAIILMSYFLKKNALRKPTKNPKQIKVMTSFYPLYFFTLAIGKDSIQVNNLTPSGSEPHDYKPTTQDMRRIEESNLLIVNGAGLEPWVGKLQYDLVKNHIEIVSIAEHIIDEKGEKIPDPHMWLDPLLAQQAVLIITQALVKINPPHALFYNTNSKILTDKLNTLDQEFRHGLQNCAQKYIIISHATLGYVSTRYKLKQVAIQGVIPDEEPSPQKLADISTFAKANNVHYIFFENPISHRLTDTIAQEIGAQTLLFNPLEGLSQKEEQNGADYFSIQSENLTQLRKGLECQ